jgi:hypothetical protein
VVVQPTPVSQSLGVVQTINTTVALINTAVKSSSSVLASTGTTPVKNDDGEKNPGEKQVAMKDDTDTKATKYDTPPKTYCN